MLTIEKLAILLKFDWDYALFQQRGSVAEQALLTGLDWDEYAGLRQDLMLAAKKLLAPEYARRVHRCLLAACADEATAQTFIGYASTL